MYSKRHKNVKIGQRKRSYVSKKYNNNRNRNINGGSRYRRYGKTGGAGIVSSMDKAVSKLEDWIRTKIVRKDTDGNKYEFVEKNSNTFMNDLFNGEGKITMKNGDVYKSKPKEGKFMEDGKFVDSKLNGHGKVTYAKVYNGIAGIEGEWENGTLPDNGTVKITYADGDVYEGKWNNCTDGYGKKTYDNGDVYEGEWKSDKWDGKGKMTWKSGFVYEGQWKDNKREGKGKMTEIYYYDFVSGHKYAGNVYEGQWKNNMQEGKGRISYYNNRGNAVYIDYMEWKNGSPSGKIWGRTIYANGATYKGSYYYNETSPIPKTGEYWEGMDLYYYIDGTRSDRVKSGMGVS